MAELAEYSTVEAVFSDLGCTELLTKEFIKIALSDIGTFDRKQHDYGSNNISMFGTEGILVRVWDKLARILNLRKRGEKPANEPLTDAWKDMRIYGVMAEMCNMGVWPGVAGSAADEVHPRHDALEFTGSLPHREDVCRT